jgi:uncharacterized protein DUF1579
VSRSIMFLFLLLATPWAQGAADPPEQLQRFAWMTGDWETVATYRLAPGAPSFEARSTEKVRWAVNNQFLISEEEGIMPDGWHRKLIVTCWHEKEHNYKIIDIDLTGEVTELAATMDGDVETIVYNPFINGHRVHTKLKVIRVSDNEYTMRGECTNVDKTWVCCDAVSKKKLPAVTN